MEAQAKEREENINQLRELVERHVLSLSPAQQRLESPTPNEIAADEGNRTRFKP